MPRTVLLVLVASAASLLLAATAPTPTADDRSPRAQSATAGTATAPAAAGSAEVAAFLSGRLADDPAAGGSALIARGNPSSVAGSDGADAPAPAGAADPSSPAPDLSVRIAPADGRASAAAEANPPQARGPDRLHSTGPPTDPAHHGADEDADPAVAPDRAETTAPPLRRASASPEGFLVAGGGSQAGDGREVTFTVEIEDGIGVALPELVATVEAALHAPASWAHDHSLRRVDDPSAASIRILLASPATVDALCARAGLRTNGIFSCWNGRFAALNAMRWVDGAEGFGDDLDGYRRYLVNHEFGHGLGYGHVGCPAAGAPAPIMMQQTKDTGACVPNGWPHPHLASDATG